MNDFVPRKWQKEAVEQVVTMAQDGAERTLVFGCPGSGKTYLGLLIARELIRRVEKTKYILVITPNLAIKSQWIERAKLMGIDLMAVGDGRQLQQKLLPMGIKGYIVNYQQAINLKRSLRLFCDEHAPVAILDEVHHTAGSTKDRDGNAWGHAVEFALANASFKLPMTGTPFREGDNPIAFVKYNEEGEATAGIRYTYEMAIREGVCRPVEFAFFDGYMDWSSKNGQRMHARFTTQVSQRLSRERLQAALSTDGQFPNRMLAAAHERLLELRAGSGVDAKAGGLVVAMNVEHAQQIADVLTDISGKPPLVVHSTIDDAQDRINAFRDSDDPWMVGISMLSEGVDIPRLRVGVYCSRNRTALYFHQFCGRFTRVQEDRHERSHVFLPRDPEIEAIAIEIEKERYHAIGEEPPRRREGSGQGGHQVSEIEVEGSDGDEVASVVSGVVFDREYQNAHSKEVDDFRRISPDLQFSTARILKLLVDMKVIEPPKKAG
jgi:superfamily II DNA or RNA helicase